MRYSFWIIILIALSPVLLAAQNNPILKPEKKQIIKVSEPSDICFSTKLQSFFVVGDNGSLYQVDTTGKIVKKAKYKGFDFEGITCDNDFIYVVEESNRNIIVFDIKTLDVIENHTISYNGARNKGFESISHNPQTDEYYLFTERDPLLLYIMNKGFSENRMLYVDWKIRDISSCCIHDNALWVLSDENSMLLKIRLSDFSIEKQWILNIINPEGLCFLPGNQLVIISDTMQKMFFFNTDKL